jgi:DNA-binding MarR family transcriptional regulator
MSFQGSLRELQLADIVQLFSTSGKTGKFFLTRDDEQGTLYLKGGQIVHAEVDDVVGDEAVHVLASWASGEFRFEPGEETDRVSIHKSNARLLMEAAHQHDEWRVLSRKVPGLDSVPTLASPDAGRPVTLSPAEWGLIVRIDGKKSVRELAKESDSSSFDVAKLLYGLVTANLVEMLAPPRERTPSDAGDERRVFAILCTRIRQEAELALGEESSPALERAHNRALAGIERDAGLEALRVFVSETEKAISSRRGAAPSKAFQEKMPVVLQRKA